MAYDPEKHHRRSIRLRYYDYRQVGAYYVTICTHNRVCTLGEVNGEGEMFLNTTGCIAEGDWEQLPEIYPHVELDAYVVMPNHVHGIIVIAEDNRGGSGRGMASPLRTRTFRAPVPGELGGIVGTFKSMSARRINKTMGTSGAPVWQRNYYEHVIRDNPDLDRIRTYIYNNPAKWADDVYNPATP